MPNMRLMSANNLARTQTVNGRTYSVAAGGSVDVPDFDAYIMLADGWVTAAGGATATLVGATAARPTNPALRQAFHDTTLGVTIVWDGKNWRNPASGAAV